MSKYEPVIGLEVHAQLNTRSKMFCACDNNSKKSEPNTNVCPVCMGFPGTLPVPNRQAIEWTIKLGLALGGTAQDSFNFERKNYFYPDLPKAYQITSSTVPPVVGGSVTVEGENGPRGIKINHIHLEEDAGKLLHDKSGKTLVDLNRAGTPLTEMVTEPDIHSAEEAKNFLTNYRSILRHLGVSEANMEEGHLRCDVNISLKPAGSEELGTKVEIKNLNSFKMIQRAIEYEIERQTDALDSGEKIVQETRGWDDIKGRSTSQRSKEEAHDYRYFPEPDIPPITAITLDDGGINVDSIRAQIPELPDEKNARFRDEFGLNEKDASILVGDLDLAAYYEKVISCFGNVDQNKRPGLAKKAANWILVELLGRVKAASTTIDKQPAHPEHIAELLIAIDKGTISGKMAKDIFDEMFQTGKSPSVIIKEKGLEQLGDESAIEKIVLEVIGENAQSVEDYKAGKDRAFGFLVGQVMKKSQGKANPKIASDLLREKLK